MKIKVSVKRCGKAGKPFLVKAAVKSRIPVVERKWSDGRRDISYFTTAGTYFHTRFLVYNPGIYTVYAELGNGEKAVRSIDVKKSAGLRKENIAVICILVAATCLVVASSYISSHRSQASRKAPTSSLSSRPVSQSQSDKLEDNGDSSAIDGAYQGKSRAATLRELEKEQVIVTDNLSSSIDFASGQKGASGRWMMENPSKNNVIMQAEIVLNGQVIATSASVRPGQHIESISLGRNISYGTAKAIAYISYYSLQSHEYLGKAGYQINLEVQ